MSVDHAPGTERLRVDGVTVLGAISPSRASDFMTCPLMFRFRTVDRLPETSSVDAVRGTLVHKVLEDLFSLPAAERTPERAQEMIAPTWETFVANDPLLLDMFAAAEDDTSETGFPEWLRSAGEVLDRYFDLEDPRRLEPADRELYVETLLDSKLLLRGFIDRVDVARDGAIRLVDYKGLAVDTPLPTPSGWTTMADVQVGDRLLGLDGRPTTVTVKSEIHHRPCFRITLRDGSSLICDNVHLWSVVSNTRQRLTHEILDAESLFALHRRLMAESRPGCLWIDAAAAVQGVHRDLPIDPWLLGVWLGAGKATHGSLTVGRQDLDDMVTSVKEAWPRGVSVTADETATTITLTEQGDRFSYGHTFTAELRRAGVLGDKHVPSPYLRAGTDQRIALLRGLMDTDGWWNRTRHRAGFTTTSDRLAADVLELVRSLGLDAEHLVKPRANAARTPPDGHVIEFIPHGFNPFALPRKALAAAGGATPSQLRLAGRRVIASIEPVPSVPTQCVAVDAADSLYLAGPGFVPTHNTGSSPHPDFEAKALFQMRFYALLIWRTRGVVPKMLQLVYLGNGELVRYEPDEEDLLATERKIEAIWDAVRRADEERDWQPHVSRACDWCSFKPICPAWGGTPPPVPERRVRPGDAPPTGPRWFDRLRRWWRRSTSGGPSRSAR